MTSSPAPAPADTIPADKVRGPDVLRRDLIAHLREYRRTDRDVPAIFTVVEPAHGAPVLVLPCGNGVPSIDMAWVHDLTLFDHRSAPKVPRGSGKTTPGLDIEVPSNDVDGSGDTNDEGSVLVSIDPSMLLSSLTMAGQEAFAFEAGLICLKCELERALELAETMLERGMALPHRLRWVRDSTWTFLLETEFQLVPSTKRLSITSLVMSNIFHYLPLTEALLPEHKPGHPKLPPTLFDKLHSITLIGQSRIPVLPLPMQRSLPPTVRYFTVPGPAFLENVHGDGVVSVTITLGVMKDSRDFEWYTYQPLPTAAVAGFHNLTQLAMTRVTLPDGSVDGLATLTRLTSLTLDACMVDPSVPAIPFEQRPSFATLSYLKSNTRTFLVLLQRAKLPALTCWHIDQDHLSKLPSSVGVQPLSLFPELGFPKFARATMVDPALALNLSLEQFPPLRRIVHNDAHDSCLHFVGNNWLSRIESLAVLASFPQAETTVHGAAPAVKELVLHSLSGIDFRAPHVQLPKPDWGHLPVLETLVFAGPSFTDASLEFVERITQWPRLRRIIVRRDQFRHAAQFPVRIVHPVPTHPLLMPVEKRRAMWARHSNEDDESDGSESDGSESDHDDGSKGTSDDDGSASSSGDRDEEDGESSSHDSTSSDDGDDDDGAYLPDPDDPHPTSFGPTAPRPFLTLTYYDGSAVVWPQLTRIIGALPPLRALQILLTTTNADTAVIARTALWVARVSKRPKARPLPVVLFVAVDVQGPLHNRDAVERMLARSTVVFIGHFAYNRICSRKMTEAGEIIKWTSFAVCIVVSALFLWLFRQRQDQAMDLLEVYSRQVLDTERRTQAMLQEVMAQRHVRYEEDTIDPLPKYTVHAAADEPHIDLADLESRLAVIVEELASGAIVVTAEEPVMAMSPASSVAGSAPGSPRLGPSNARSTPRRRPDSGTTTPPMRSGAVTPPIRSGTSTPPLRSGTQSPLMAARFHHVLGRHSPHHSRQPSATSARGAPAPGYTASPRASDESDDIPPHPHQPRPSQGDDDVLAAISGHPPSQATRGRTPSRPSSPVHEHAHGSNRHSWISAPVHLTLSLPPPPNYDAALAAPPVLSAIPEVVQDVEVEVPSPIPCSQDLQVTGDAASMTSAFCTNEPLNIRTIDMATRRDPHDRALRPVKIMALLAVAALAVGMIAAPVFALPAPAVSTDQPAVPAPAPATAETSAPALPAIVNASPAPAPALAAVSTAAPTSKVVVAAVAETPAPTAAPPRLIDTVLPAAPSPIATSTASSAVSAAGAGVVVSTAAPAAVSSPAPVATAVPTVAKAIVAGPDPTSVSDTGKVVVVTPTPAATAASTSVPAATVIKATTTIPSNGDATTPPAVIADPTAPATALNPTVVEPAASETDLPAVTDPSQIPADPTATPDGTVDPTLSPSIPTATSKPAGIPSISSATAAPTDVPSSDASAPVPTPTSDVLPPPAETLPPSSSSPAPVPTVAPQPTDVPLPPIANPPSASSTAPGTGAPTSASTPAPTITDVPLPPVVTPVPSNTDAPLPPVVTATPGKTDAPPPTSGTDVPLPTPPSTDVPMPQPPSATSATSVGAVTPTATPTDVPLPPVVSPQPSATASASPVPLPPVVASDAPSAAPVVAPTAVPTESPNVPLPGVVSDAPQPTVAPAAAESTTKPPLPFVAATSDGAASAASTATAPTPTSASTASELTATPTDVPTARVRPDAAMGGDNVTGQPLDDGSSGADANTDHPIVGGGALFRPSKSSSAGTTSGTDGDASTTDSNKLQANSEGTTILASDGASPMIFGAAMFGGLAVVAAAMVVMYHQHHKRTTNAAAAIPGSPASSAVDGVNDDRANDFVDVTDWDLPPQQQQDARAVSYAPYGMSTDAPTSSSLTVAAGAASMTGMPLPPPPPLSSGTSVVSGGAGSSSAHGSSNQMSYFEL
ncbi:hypothetical protein GGF32_003517 [Allomyces javanicus]|nr:hypothetical protein GGF32_003517 [Allomyces javanicus]